MLLQYLRLMRHRRVARRGRFLSPAPAEVSGRVAKKENALNVSWRRVGQETAHFLSCLRQKGIEGTLDPFIRSLAVAKLSVAEARRIVWIQAQHKPRQANVCRNELQAGVLVDTSFVSVPELVHLEVQVSIGELVQLVGLLERAAAGHRTIPNRLVSSKLGDQALQLSENVLLLAHLQLCPVREQRNKAAPAHVSAANGITRRRRHIVSRVGKRLTAFAAAVLYAEVCGAFCTAFAVRVLAAFAAAVLYA